MTPFTRRPWFAIGVAAALCVGAVVALAAGAGLFALAPLLLGSIAAAWGRQALRVDDDGVRYRALLPSESFAVPWSEITEVVVDTRTDGAPGTARSPVTRARFLRRSGSGQVATLFSEADAAPLIAACEARRVPVVDER